MGFICCRGSYGVFNRTTLAATAGRIIMAEFKEWFNIAEKYPYPMREAVRRFRHYRILRESTEPQVGIYYWVPLPNKIWDIMKFYESHYGDLMHEATWEKEVAPYLIHIWKLKLSPIQSDEFTNAYAGLPRGRVVLAQNKYFHYHGGDAPNPSQSETIIQREFGLPSVTSVVDEHEQMLDYDKKLIQSILGVTNVH